jgi:hypothetical protein
LRDSAESNHAHSVSSTQSTSAGKFKHSRGDTNLLPQAGTAPRGIPVDEPMDLLTASFNTKQSLERPRWISSTVRILQDQSSGNFRVLICQEDSLLREVIGNPQPFVCV